MTTWPLLEHFQITLLHETDLIGKNFLRLNTDFLFWSKFCSLDQLRIILVFFIQDSTSYIMIATLFSIKFSFTK